MKISPKKQKQTEKQRLQKISQLIKKDLTNLKKQPTTEINTAELICTPHDIFHTKKRKR